MGGLLNQYIAQKHAEKMQQAQERAEANIHLVDAGIRGEVPPGAAWSAYQELAPHIPAPAKPWFQVVGQHLEHLFTGGGQQPAPQPKTLAQGPSIDTSGANQQPQPMPMMSPPPPTGDASPQPAPEIPHPSAGTGGNPPTIAALGNQPPAQPAQPIPPPPSGGPGMFFTPTQRAENQVPFNNEAIRMKAAEAKAQQEAEAQRLMDVSKFNRTQNLQTIKDLQGQGVNHIHWQTDANGNMTVHPDMGKPIPGLVQGADFPEEKLDPNRFYRVKEFEDGKREFTPETGVTNARVMPDPGSATGFSLVWFDRAGQEVSRKPGATPPPGLFPTSTSTSGVRMVQQPDGSTVAVPVTTQSTRTPQVPGMAAPVPPPPSGSVAPVSTPRPAGANPAGRVVGGRPLPEAAKEKFDQQYTTLDRTQNVLQRIRDNYSILNNMLTAGKIQLAMSPEGMAQVISRGVPLTDQEAQMAADMNTLKENINTLRGPLGATGFRGPEAFAALQAQRGSILANPKVSQAIINNTLRQLQDQKGVIERSFKQHGLEIPPSNTLTPPPGGLPAAAKSQLKEGVNTTFGNGQVWTLKNGQEQRVQ